MKHLIILTMNTVYVVKESSSGVYEIVGRASYHTHNNADYANKGTTMQDPEVGSEWQYFTATGLVITTTKIIEILDHDSYIVAYGRLQSAKIRYTPKEG